MRAAQILMLVLLFFEVANPIYGKKHNKQDFILLEAFTQRTLPGVRTGKPQTETKFIIIWQGKKHPEKFFWESNHAIQGCNITRVHKVNRSKNMQIPDGMDYMPEAIDLKKITCDDTLQVSILNNTNIEIPTDIPKNLDNFLVYELENRKWRTFAITNIAKKRDIAMP